ncbi:MAG: hypothetical protein ACJ8M4_10435 [Chthoniobacterales bacterium]
MPNYGYHLARAKGRAIRTLYRAFLGTLPRLEPPRTFPLSVFSYSGEAALPEQVASIRSFLRYVGRPVRFTVVSDGTYSESSRRLLAGLDSCVSVAHAGDWLPKNLPEKLYPYLSGHPTGRQLGLIMSLPTDAAVLYCDSDIRFFPGADHLYSYLDRRDAPALYQADCRFSGDKRLVRDEAETRNPVNTGFLLLYRPLDWTLSIERFLALADAPNFFTNQTMTHLTMHANGAAAFDPRKYILQLDDQFAYRDHYTDPQMALRHYVNPVRHKFWTSLSA